ncbi:MAG: sugar kinase [Proteobacteria bacterium]|nr:sugar kinase [Pseudomonadota bacterium]
MKHKVITFGEIMLRLAPLNGICFEQANACETTFGGSEANVAVALANYGLKSSFVSKLPDNVIGQAALDTLRRYGVDTSHIVRGGNRLGMYLLEKGWSPCSSICTYDRAGSAMAEAVPKDFSWDKIFEDAGWFHLSGITPALSPAMARICLAAVVNARKRGMTVSCDVNFRSKLWSFEEAGKTMGKLCQYVDVLIINEEEAKVLGIDIANEQLTNYAAFYNMAHALKKQYPHVTAITSVARIDNNRAVKAMLWTQEVFQSAVFPLHVVDPVGAGDAFCAALIYGMLRRMENQQLINFAAAACALKHSIKGDFNLVPLADIERLAAQNGSSGVQR